VSLLNLVERSITAEALVAELTQVLAAHCFPSQVLRMDNGSEMFYQALQRFCQNKTGRVYIPPGCPWDNGYIERFNNRQSTECLNRNEWNTLFEARVSSATSSTSTITDTATRPSATAGRPSTPRPAGAPTPRHLQDRPKLDHNNPTPLLR
jgi:transposase InsO family protein